MILQAFQCLTMQRVEDVYTQSLMVYAYTIWSDSDAKQAQLMQSMQTKAVVTGKCFALSDDNLNFLPM